MSIIQSIRSQLFKTSTKRSGYDDATTEVLWNYYQKLKDHENLQRFIGGSIWRCDKELLYGTAVLFSFLSEQHIEWYIGTLQKAKHQKATRTQLKSVCHSIIATMKTTGYIDHPVGHWPKAFDDAIARVLAEVLHAQLGDESVETYTASLTFNIRRYRRTDP